MSFKLRGICDMKYQCEVVQDLLPLYEDEVCSESSSKMIKEHLEECRECSNIARKLKDRVIDNKLFQEKDEVIKHHTRQVQKQTATVGAVVGGVLTIPVIICLIVNLAVGHALDWFFIVLASLLVVASLSVVPLVIMENKGIKTLLSFTGSLLFLLFVCNLYSGGSWFIIAAVSVLCGLFLLFAPAVLYIYQSKLPKGLANKKALLYTAVGSVLIYMVVLTCGFYASTPDYYRIAFTITTVSMVLPWLFLLVIRYLKTDGFMKAGICFFIFGIFYIFINPVIDFVLEGKKGLTISNRNLMSWNYDTVNGNIDFIFLLASICAAILLILISAIRKKTKGHKENGK